jgi:hypothetical protein
MAVDSPYDDLPKLLHDLLQTFPLAIAKEFKAEGIELEETTHV